MPRWAMAIDLDKCTACGACVAVCKMENNVPYVEPGEALKGRAIIWLRILNRVEGEYPKVQAEHVPSTCYHCDKPPCARVCPVHATYRADNGIVAQIYPRCIGCRYCMAACPYTAKYFNWYEPKWEDTMSASRNPDVSCRLRGNMLRSAVTGCNRVENALERRDAHLRSRTTSRLAFRHVLPKQ